jgi:nicotinamide riboside kinase
MSRLFVFAGAQGTGKTTILNEVVNEYKDMEVITNVVRNLYNKGDIRINKKGNGKTQQLIYDTLKHKYIDYLYNSCYEDFNTGCICDRSLVDVVAYTKYLYERGKASRKSYEEQLKDLKEWAIYHRYGCLYIYIPIEFPAVVDGVRDIDEEYRKEIDENIKWLLKECNIDYYILEGSIEERVEMMKNIIEFNKIGDQ